MRNAEEKRHNLLEPCLLLLLSEKPAHGYDLARKLIEFGFFEKEKVDAGTVYRTLRQLEKEGLVRSLWETEGPGPAKRVYEFTPKAVGALAMWADKLEEMVQRLKSFHQQLEKFRSSRAEIK